MPAMELEAAIRRQVETDGFNEKYLLEFEAKEDAIDTAIRQIWYDVTYFDDWFFSAGTEEVDERVDFLGGVSDKEDLVPSVRNVVEVGLKELREVDDLPIEPDVDKLVGQLTWYIENWQNWYYPYKVRLNEDDFADMYGVHQAIYMENDYGDPEKSLGVGLLTDEPV